MKAVFREFSRVFLTIAFVLLACNANLEASELKGPVLIEGAMDVEVDSLASQLKDVTELDIGGWRYISGTYKDVPVVICKTFVGKVNAAAATAVGIERFHPSAVINQGTCGAHVPELNVSDLIVAERTADIDAYKSRHAEQGEGIDPMKNEVLDLSIFDDRTTAFCESDTWLVEIALREADAYKAGRVVKGVIGSGSGFHNEVDHIILMHKLFGTTGEEMEADAAAKVARAYGIPFVGLRVVSNSVYHENNKEDFGVARALQHYVLEVAKAYAKAK